MTTDFDYSQVPSYFTHCFNERCSHADRCLRRLATLHADASRAVVEAVSPAYWPTGNDPCKAFQPIQPIRLAWGLKRILGTLPHNQSRGAASRLNGMFAKTTLYRITNGIRPLSPAEQDRIAAVFSSYGVAKEDVFDRWTDSYDWQPFVG